MPNDPPISDPTTPDEPPKKKRGFATMDPEQVRAYARLGGIAAHANGVGHEFTPEEARKAGRKGGLAMHQKRRAAKEGA